MAVYVGSRRHSCAIWLYMGRVISSDKIESFLGRLLSFMSCFFYSGFVWHRRRRLWPCLIHLSCFFYRNILSFFSAELVHNAENMAIYAFFLVWSRFFFGRFSASLCCFFDSFKILLIFFRFWCLQVNNIVLYLIHRKGRRFNRPKRSNEKKFLKKCWQVNNDPVI